MSSIQGIGQGLLQYIQTAKSTAVDGGIGQSTESEKDAEGQTGRYQRNHNQGPFGAALLMTLQKYGVDPDQFQADFMAALRSVSGVEPGSLNESALHLNAVG